MIDGDEDKDDQDAAGLVEGEEGEDEEWEPDENDLEQARKEVNLEDLPEAEREKIRQAIIEMMMGRGQAQEKPKRVFREYKRPIGRRHHAVMHVKGAKRGPRE